MSAPTPNAITPRTPKRPLLWSDAVYALQDLLAEHTVYVVGGAVRDAYLHRPLKDIDLAVPRDALKIARKIANHFDGAFFVLDPKREVGRAILRQGDAKLMVDVALFRDGDTLLADLHGRDFTLNAMAVDLAALDLLLDPLHGEDDLAAKQLRLCSPSAVRDDPIRALRAVRQSTQLRLRLHADTILAIRTLAPHKFETQSAERVRDELVNLLALPTAAQALRVGLAVGLAHVLGAPIAALTQHADGWARALLALEKLSELLSAISYQRTDNTAASFGLGMAVIQLDRYRMGLNEHLAHAWPNDRPHRALLALAVLWRACHAVGIAIDSETHGAALALSNDEITWLKAVVSAEAAPDLTALGLHRWWRTFPLEGPARAAGVDACLLVLVDYLATHSIDLPHEGWLQQIAHTQTTLAAYYQHYDTIIAPPPLVNGTTLMQALGLAPSPRIKQLLAQLREAQVRGEISNAEEALARARAWADAL
jgi:hypothetical protein